MSVSSTSTTHQYYVVNTGITSTYTRSNLAWGFNVPVMSRNPININHRAGGQQFFSNIQLFNQTFTQDQINDLQTYLLNKYFMNISMTPVYLAPTTNWAGRELTKDGRCGGGGQLFQSGIIIKEGLS